MATAMALAARPVWDCSVQNLGCHNGFGSTSHAGNFALEEGYRRWGGAVSSLPLAWGWGTKEVFLSWLLPKTRQHVMCGTVRP